MRGRVLESLQNELESVEYGGFMVYLMGPYKSHSPYRLDTEDEDNEEENDSEDLEILMSLDETLEKDRAWQLLERIREELREEVGVNAFLATDAGIDAETMDYASQSLLFSEVSNAVIFVTPALGKNLGVGVETGSVLEYLPENDIRHRTLFIHEESVTSGMIDAVSARWEPAVDDYSGIGELVERIKTHIRIVAQDEAIATQLESKG